MPWVLYREKEEDYGESYLTMTEVLAVVTDPETVKRAIPDEVIGAWPLDRQIDCHKWQFDEEDRLWRYIATASSWSYILREFALDDLSEVEK